MHVRHLRDPEKHPGYMIGYFTVSYLITHFVIPFTVMIFMNGNVCWTMLIQRGVRAMLTRQVRPLHFALAFTVEETLKILRRKLKNPI